MVFDTTSLPDFVIQVWYAFLRVIWNIHCHIWIESWRHDMEMLSTLLALCEGNPSVTSWFSSERVNDTGPCITTAIWRGRNNFSQWPRSFQRKLRCQWLKFLRQRHVAVVIQVPGLSYFLVAGLNKQMSSWVAVDLTLHNAYVTSFE